MVNGGTMDKLYYEVKVAVSVSGYGMDRAEVEDQIADRLEALGGIYEGDLSVNSIEIKLVDAK